MIRIYPNVGFFTWVVSYFVPKYKKNIPINTKMRSIALLFKFFSRKNIAPNKKDTTTLPRLTMETMEIIESSKLSA